MDGVNMNPFQREEFEKYQQFLKSAKSYFPNHTGLKRLNETVVDFQLLLATIFDARAIYPGYKEESLLLCQQIATFATRHIDSKDREMFQSQLLYECEFAYKYIIEKSVTINDSLDVIAHTTQEIVDHFFIEEIRSLFPNESWSQYAMDLDKDILVALIMQTDAYKMQEEDALSIVYEIAEYECRNIYEDEREMFIEQYLCEIRHSEQDLLAKYGLIQFTTTQVTSSEAPGRVTFEKEVGKRQQIVVQVSKKSSKNKRQKSAENQIADLIQKGKSFEVLPKPKNTKNGIKRVVVRLSFEAVVNYIESILPSNASFQYTKDSAKVLFGKINKITENQKKRVVFSRQ